MKQIFELVFSLGEKDGNNLWVIRKETQMGTLSEIKAIIPDFLAHLTEFLETLENKEKA